MVQLLGQEVGSTGFGLMGLTWRATPQPEEESFKAMKAAIKAGCVFWNGGEFYGTPELNSLTLLEKYFTKYPEDADKVILSIKGGNNGHVPDSSPENVKRSIDECLRLLNGKKKLDIFECARVDKKTPIEVTMEYVDKEYVQTGKIGGIALSEVSAATVECAVKVTKIVAVEIEVSLFATDPLTSGLFEACAKHEIPIVAYSPLGRGMLTGQIKSLDDIPQDSLIKHFPRFSPENFPKNLELVKSVQDIAESKGCTPGQLAISWVRHLSGRNGNPAVIPIPGATKESRIVENAKEITLEKSDLETMDKILASFEPSGARYPGPIQAYCDV
ncbi:NADP-dependent oxidoreductase domain-containing protein [Calycina marina]|uniref:NADP-dependent oxidoreductase domain-containing protein n=1 Tax=Calycina marina TaxID=1763456 RepID=A0A9P8CKA9_9HELO|nr:NADP-dependent oxidoreductase domain-containing protein [Calycina marina]